MRTVAQNLYDLYARIDPRSTSNQKFKSRDQSVVITGCVNNGSGLVRVTTATAHGLFTGQSVFIGEVKGTIEANNTVSSPSHVVTRISATQFDIPVTFANAYISGGIAVGILIGAMDGQRFTAQRMISLYNEARYVVLASQRAVYGDAVAMERCGTSLVSGVLTWTQSGSQSTAPIPSGYMEFESMHTSADVPMILSPPEYGEVVRAGLGAGFTNPDFVQSASKIFIFEGSGGFVHYGTFVPTGTGYKIRYLGLAPFSIFTDVTLAETQETLKDDLTPYLLQAAELLSTEMGAQKVAEVIGGMFRKAG